MFNRFLDWFERHKVAVVGTLMLHTMLLFTLAMSKLPRENTTEAPPEMTLQMQPPVDMPPDPMLQPPQLAPLEVKNLTSNSTASSEQPRAYISRGTQERISTDVEQDLKDFEAAEFQRLADERKAAGKDVTIPALDPSKWDKERYMDKPDRPTKVEGLTTVTYDLVGRTDQVLDVPAYKCEGQGRVVVRVSVARNGGVERADLDDGATTADECMRENALSSARNARFNSSASSPDPQRGTITYIFLAQ